MDEAFELLTLMQTGKSDLHPIVLLEEPGSTYWTEWMQFLHRQLIDRQLISTEDMYLLRQADSIEEAVEELTHFYSNYQSQRYVLGRLILRVRRLPPDDEMQRLRATFADIIGPRGLKKTDPSPVEIRDNDELDCARLAMDFNQMSFGRLRRLIDELNRF
jgi:hypothetical protein